MMATGQPNTITREALAAACRSLADDCEAGRGPDLGRYATFVRGAPVCAIGHACAGAGWTTDVGTLGPSTMARALGINPRALDCILHDAASEVSAANDDAPANARAAAVVAPLRALADALQTAKEEPPHA